MTHTTQMHAMARVIADVMAERTRQIGDEGFTTDHDDDHGLGELAAAAACYARFAGDPTYHQVPPGWPWSADWWKPSTDRRRDLVKACALLVAEIERMDRAERELAARSLA